MKFLFSFVDSKREVSKMQSKTSSAKKVPSLQIVMLWNMNRIEVAEPLSATQREERLSERDESPSITVLLVSAVHFNLF